MAGFKPSPVWTENKDAIYNDFRSGMNNSQLSKKWGVSKPSMPGWRKKFDEEENYVFIPEVQIRNRILEEDPKNIEQFRESGVEFLHKCLKRMNDLIDEETSIKSIALAINAVIPYIMAKKEDSEGSDTSFAFRRNQFIQNIQNNYNLKTDENETGKAIGNHRDPAKPTPGNK